MSCTKTSNWKRLATLPMCAKNCILRHTATRQLLSKQSPLSGRLRHTGRTSNEQERWATPSARSKEVLSFGVVRQSQWGHLASGRTNVKAELYSDPEAQVMRLIEF